MPGAESHVCQADVAWRPVGRRGFESEGAGGEDFAPKDRRFLGAHMLRISGRVLIGVSFLLGTRSRVEARAEARRVSWPAADATQRGSVRSNIASIQPIAWRNSAGS